MAKKFHFQELDLVVSFPDEGNDGKKYNDYAVLVSSVKKKGKERNCCLVDVVESSEFQCFPHTVGFFKSETPSCSDYLELRIIRCVEEFWKFLNDLNL